MRAALVLHISRYDQPNPKFHTLYETFRKLYCVDTNCENKADSNLALLYPTKVSNVLLFLLHVLSAVAMRETKEALESVGSSLEILQEGTIKLKTSLSDERASLSNTLSDPACTNGAVSQTCNTIRSTVPQLGASADFTKVLRTTYYYYYICLMNGSELSFCSPTLIFYFLSISFQTSVTLWSMSTTSWEQTSATLYRRSVPVTLTPFLLSSFCFRGCFLQNRARWNTVEF